MARKPDEPSKGREERGEERRISATEASRTFSNLLDRVEAGGRFVIHRRGRDICVMSPASPRGRPPVLLDDQSGKDLMDLIRGEPREGL